MRFMRLATPIALVLVVFFGSSAHADYKRDVERAISNLKRADMKGGDREFSAYERILREYASKRNDAMERLLSKLESTDADVASDWKTIAQGLNETFFIVGMDLLTVYREHNSEGADSWDERIGFKSFRDYERTFTSALANDPILPRTRTTALNTIKQASASLDGLDRKVADLVRSDDDVDAKRDQAGNNSESAVLKMVKTVRDEFADGSRIPPTFPYGDLFQVVALATQATDQFWIWVQTEEGTVWAAFVRARDEATKLRDETRFDLIERLIDEDSRKASDVDGFRMRGDYGSDYAEFHARAVGRLKYLTRDLHDRIKDRLLSAVNEDLNEKFTEGARFQEFLDKMELDTKTLEELMTRWESAASNSTSLSPEGKSRARELKEKVLTANLYRKWSEGYRQYKVALDRNRLK